MTRTELLAVAKPILFNTEITKAIQNGTKTTTRRCVKPKSKNAYGFFVTTKVSDGTFAGVYDYDEDENAFDNPQKEPYKVGDILYVRETWKQATCDPAGGGYALTDTYLYKADCKADSKMLAEDKWHPSIHMPKNAARIFLRVTDVRVERLQDIDENGIRNEGLSSMAVHVGDMEIAQAEFAHLWNTTVKKSDLDRYGWDANPWVWVIEFERVEVTK